jgi:hypothetical protein
MGVEFAVMDGPYPYVCAVYRCRCGAVATEHGGQAALPPPGWQVAGAARAESVVCPRCAERVRATSRS